MNKVGSMGRKWGKYPIWFGLRLSEEEATRLRAAAAARGITVSDLLRELIQHGLTASGRPS